MKHFYLLLCLLCLCGGCAKPNSAAYREMYAHLEKCKAPYYTCYDGDYFLIIFVDAPHLDYTDNVSFFKTVAKHPNDGSKEGDVGHAWVYLQGVVDGERVYLEGGHSGELGSVQPKYFDGIMNYIDYGYANPTPEQCLHPIYEANPIKYLWETQKDGFFQWGRGGHTPTYALRLDLTEDQFNKILFFLQSYPFEDYSLTGNQCTSFVVQIAALAGVDLESEVTIPIESSIYFRGRHLHFWCDPFYSRLTIASPDILERSLMTHSMR